MSWHIYNPDLSSTLIAGVIIIVCCVSCRRLFRSVQVFVHVGGIRNSDVGNAGRSLAAAWGVGSGRFAKGGNYLAIVNDNIAIIGVSLRIGDTHHQAVFRRRT